MSIADELLLTIGGRVFEFFHKLLSQDFIPHGHCYLWDPGMVWLQVISNALIGLSYVTISSTLAYLIYRIRDLPFHWMYLAFGLFIIACGFTHFMDIVTVWHPFYWIDGTIRAITAVASVGTALILPPLIPKIIALVKGAKAAHDKGIHLETAYQQLGEVFAKTKELDVLKTHFFANVSHELRTPLALIIGPADRMKDDANLSIDQRRNLEVIDRNARVLLKHVNDLLDVAKLEARKMKPKYVQSDLAQLIRLIASNFDGLAKDKNIDFRVEVPDTIHCQCDVDMIQRVILNLLSNAFKFVPDGGRIKISGKQNGHFAIFLIDDSGPGIAPDMRDAVFERFRQIEGGPTRSHGGTGLGLSIAKEFIELHRGTIWVDQSTDGGACFKFQIPERAPVGELVSVRFANAAPEENTQAALAELKKTNRQLEVIVPELKIEKGFVLVVEDNPDMNRFVSEILSTQYRIETAFDGKSGLEKAEMMRPDLILSDIMMPIMSGDQMISEIRKNPTMNEIPIILLTAKADDELRNRLLSESAQDYIVKPFSPEELIARVKNQVMMKRARDALQRELASQVRDLESLATEVSNRKKELQATVYELRIAKEAAESASRAKSTFLGMVSHELKTPMTSVKLQLEMLKRIEGKNLSPRQLELINRLDRSSDRSIDLMDTLFDYTKIQSGKVTAKAESIDLLQLLREIFEASQLDADEKKLELKLNLPKDLPILCSDRLLVQMVIRNLLNNAIKYTDSGTVDVNVTFEDGQHVVVVKDTGPGIPKEQHEFIFQPFEQLAPLQKKTKPGFGLGLSIASESMKALGGQIEIFSEIGKGSTFTAHFPTLNAQG